VILVVDDEPAVARAHRRGLERGGLRVEVCTAPLVALGRINAGERFDAVICDGQMPVAASSSFNALYLPGPNCDIGSSSCRAAFRKMTPASFTTTTCRSSRSHSKARWTSYLRSEPFLAHQKTVATAKTEATQASQQ
jgi:CheY-like chemotaxis protein